MHTKGPMLTQTISILGGGDYDFTLLSIDARKFLEIPNKRNVLGLWLLATFTTGDVPYDSLPLAAVMPCLPLPEVTLRGVTRARA